MPGPRGNCLIVCPLPNAIIEECKITSTAKLPFPNSSHMQKHYGKAAVVLRLSKANFAGFFISTAKI